MVLSWFDICVDGVGVGGVVLTGNRLVLLSRRARLRIELGYLGGCLFVSFWLTWPWFQRALWQNDKRCIKRRVRGESMVDI